MPRKRESADRLKWLIQFLNLDVGKLDHGEFISQFYRFLRYFYSSPELENGTLQRLCLHNEENREALREAQERVQGIFMLLWGDKCEYARTGEEVKSPLEFKPRYNVFIEGSDVKMRAAMSVCIEPENPHGERIKTWDELAKLDREGDRGGITCLSSARGDNSRHVKPLPQDLSWTVVYSEFLDPDMQTTALAFILPLFEELGLDRILICSECQRIEFTNKKKQKPLCRRCLTKARVRKWRQG